MAGRAEESVAGGAAEIFAPSRVRATMRLNFARDFSAGTTFLAASLQEPPFKVVRAFTLEDGTALVHLHNVSGGLLAGDDLTLEVNLGCNASVQLTTTGPTPRSLSPVQSFVSKPRSTLLPARACSGGKFYIRAGRRAANCLPTSES